MPENEDLPRIYRLNDVLVYAHKQRVERNGKKIKLSQKPFALLSFLLAETWKHRYSRPYSISNTEIIAKVWSDEGSPGAGTINRQTANIRAALKLECIKGTGKGHELVGEINDATRLHPEFIVANQIVVVSTMAVIFTLIATLFIRGIWVCWVLL